jgi:hypothetical protein
MYRAEIQSIEMPAWLAETAVLATALVGGALAITRTHLVFAAFGASVLIPGPVSTLALFAVALMRNQNITPAVTNYLYFAIFATSLPLAMASLIFLTMSKTEFK